MAIPLVSFFIILGIIGYFSGSLSQYITVFISSLVAILISKQISVSSLALESVLFALLIGLILAKIKWLRPKSELYIKTGLVLMGAEITLSTLMAAGLAGIFEVTVGLSIVWYFCYWLARKFGLTESFASVLATATSICGVSAAIAAGGAINGDKKEISHTISLVLLFAIPLIVLLPTLAKILSLSPAVAGAWIGGTVDNTAAVAASGSICGELALQTATIVKMSQNIMIAVAAFLLSVYWSRKPQQNVEKPTIMDIWNRFPKFVVGFIISCLIFSFIPSVGITTTTVIGVTKQLRSWLFTMAFVCVGLGTDFKELITVGGGKPLIVFVIATIFDICVSLISAMVFFG